MSTRNSGMKIALRIISAVLQLLFNIIIYVIIVMALMHYGRVAYDFGYQIFGNVSAAEAPGRDYNIQVKKGESISVIADKLENNRIIINKYSFLVKAKLSDIIILPGEYTVNSSMNYDEILSIISKAE